MNSLTRRSASRFVTTATATTAQACGAGDRACGGRLFAKVAGQLTVALAAAATLMSASAVSAAEPINIGYFPNVTHAQAVIGIKRGDFQKSLGSDWEVKPFTFNAGPSVIEALFAKRLDIAYVGPSPTINGYVKSKGEEVRVVAGAAVNGILIVGNKKRNITKLEQLKGGKIATPQLGNTQDISAKEYVVNDLKSQLKERGGDTEVISLDNPSIEILFQKDQIDAAWVPEPWGSRLIINGLANLISEEKDLWESKKFNLTNIIVRREFLEKNPEAVKKFLEAHVAITEEVRKDPLQFADIINGELTRLTGKNLPRPILESAFKYTEFTTDPAKESFEKFYDKAVTLKFLPADRVDLGRLVDTSLLQSVQKAHSNSAKAATTGDVATTVTASH